jgi:hypothetical protein
LAVAIVVLIGLTILLHACGFAGTRSFDFSSKILQQAFPDSGKHVFSQLLASVLGEMNQINELMVLSVEMWVGVHQADLRMLTAELPDDH